MVVTPRRTVGSVVAVVIGFFALADVPDQAGKWWNGITNAVSGIDSRFVLLMVAIAIGLWTWDVHSKLIAKFLRTPEPPQLRVLERYYMHLAHMQEDVQRAITFEMDDSHFISKEVAVDKLRGELINLAPALLTTATAMDLRKPDLQWTEVKKRLPDEINRLMKVVRHKWHVYDGFKAPMYG